jgi:hypothetical protein
MFKSAFIHLAHLLVHGPLGMVFEHFRDLFDPKNLVNYFSQLLLMCSYVVVRHIPESITRTFGVARLLVLASLSSGIQLIAIGKIPY